MGDFDYVKKSSARDTAMLIILFLNLFVMLYSIRKIEVRYSVGLDSLKLFFFWVNDSLKLLFDEVAENGCTCK